MTQELRIPKKLIEVALPLDAINAASAREKSIRHGHPSTLHLWWARRPLATARAVTFAQLVNDPGYERSLGRGVNQERAKIERDRLFKIIEKLVLWENVNNEDVLREAREEIWRSWRETCELNRDHPNASELFCKSKLPAFHDPFAGGGALPLEAQRLGLDVFASDLNPVAVTINKALIEIPSLFTGKHPLGPEIPGEKDSRLFEHWPKATGLAEDVRRYGYLVRNEVKRQIGHLYPCVTVTKLDLKFQPELQSYLGKDLKVIAWLWARTVKSPSPAFSHVSVPLVSTFTLSQKDGKEVYVEPTIDGDTYKFTIKSGNTPNELQHGTTAGKRAAFVCLLSGAPIDYEYIRSEGKAGRIGTKLLAIVAEAGRGRIYLSPQSSQEQLASTAKPSWTPEAELPHNPRDFKTPNYGLTKFGDLFTDRQLVLLTTYSDAIEKIKNKVFADAVKAGMSPEDTGLEDRGQGARAYADAIAVYLSLALSKLSDAQSALCRWKSTMDQSIATFGRQAIPMVWDFSEANAFGEMAGDYGVTLSNMMRVLDNAASPTVSNVMQLDAQTQEISSQKVISTDPPYYDNIGYADLSDYFYVWLRRSLSSVLPKLFASPTTPKARELVATPYRHGGKQEAEKFFLKGMTEALKRLAEGAHPAFPVTIYYAFKQSETANDEGTSSTGWETFLGAVLSAGFSITGTWPMRTELGNRVIGAGKNVLASSVVLVCRLRPKQAAAISRREFIRELNSVLPSALIEMTTGEDHSPVAPVDLSQAIIGPGMAVFSKYSAVLEADGKPMSVRTALQLINRFLAEDDFDHDTQFCLQWFENYGWAAGKFGDADVLARAKGTSVDGLRDGGVVESSSGTLRLLKPSDLSTSWKPESNARISIWELLHQMIARFYSGGESSAGELLAQANNYSEAIRTLAYRLYTTCERKGWAQDASSYDGLVRAWDSIESAARAVGYSGTQISLFDSVPSTSESQSPTKAKSRKKK